MLTLVQSCTNGYLNQSDRNEEISDKRFSKINDKLKKLKNRIIWLEPLDMEPLPGPTNLLASVLARIENAVKPYYQTSVKMETHREPSGILELCPGYLDGLQKLHRLQADVALSWEGNIAQRGAHIDPDAYSSEVNRTENARLVLNRELSNVLNHLAGNIPLACGIIDPIFVLPVDDLDLNPVRCLEVLRLLRMINVPRLFILVLGDLNIIEIVLNLKQSGEMIDTAGKSLSRRISDAEYGSIKKHVSAVVYNVMRKLLPPGQRVKIEPMQVWDALNYKPLSPNSTSLPALHQLLDGIKISLDAISQAGKPKVNNKEVKSLWDFLFYPVPYPNRNIKKSDLDSCIYKASTILRVPPRHIADWWFLLQSDEDLYSSNQNLANKINQHHEKKEIKFFIDNLGRLCRSAIGEDSSISSELRQKYREALRKSKLTDEWELFLGVTTIPETGPVDKISVPLKEDYSPAIQMEFHLCQSNGWRLYPDESDVFRDIVDHPIVDNKELNKEVERFAKDLCSFSEETASALLLFHDLYALGAQEKISRDRIFIYRPVQIWAKTVWKYGKLSRAILWPIPEFLSAWGYDIFLKHWDLAIKIIMKNNNKDKYIFFVYAWIDAATSVLIRKEMILCHKKNYSQSLNKYFEKIVVRISFLLANTENNNKEIEKTLEDDPKKELVEKWLKQVVNLIMPEISGIEKSHDHYLFKAIEKANKKTHKLKSNAFLTSAKLEIEQFRNEIFENLKKMEMDDDKTITKLTEKLKTEGDRYLSALLNSGNL
jgi:hypothetical protein